MDLQSEIEARRARLAELKRKRNLAPKYETVITELYSNTPAPAISRATQSVTSQVDKPRDSGNSIKADGPTVTETAEDDKWIVRPPSPSQVLYKFLDDAWHTVERVSKNQGPANFIQLPFSSLENEETSDLKLFCEIRGSALDCDWSPHFPQLVASVSGSEITLWSLEALDSPEYRLQAATSTLRAVRFVPGQPHLIVACGAAGQLFAWDLRDGRYDVLPAIKSTKLGYPIVDLSIATAGRIVTVSDDGLVCTWMADRLVRPSQELRISSTIVPQCVAVNSQGSVAYVGGLDGSLTTLRLTPSLGAEPGVVSTVFPAHDGPLTSLVLRSPPAGSGCASYLMTCGLDWTLRLWRINAGDKGPQIVEKIQLNDAFPSAIAWRPNHPSQFAVVSDRWLQVWDLLQDTRMPLYADSHPATKVKWNVNIAATSLEGLRVLEVPKADASLADWQAFDRKFKVSLT